MQEIWNCLEWERKKNCLAYIFIFYSWSMQIGSPSDSFSEWIGEPDSPQGQNNKTEPHITSESRAVNMFCDLQERQSLFVACPALLVQWWAQFYSYQNIEILSSSFFTTGNFVHQGLMNLISSQLWKPSPLCPAWNKDWKPEIFDLECSPWFSLTFGTSLKVVAFWTRPRDDVSLEGAELSLCSC